ncbi:hypothetical protein BH09BAC3_BH09BAC3_08940 [soil metagenome]
MPDLPEFKPRKIKFKAWDTEHKLLMRLNSIDCNKGELHKKDNILLQFTGILDKNGDEIYEMDILLVSDEKYIVFWNEEFGGWYFHPIKNPADVKIFLGPAAAKMTRLGSQFELKEPYVPYSKKKR